MKKYENKNLGITLVALVITIVILLILAGISISALTNTGLFGKAKEAQNKSEIETVKEKMTLLLNEWQIDHVTSSKTLETFLREKVTDKSIEDYKKLDNDNYEVYIDGYVSVIDGEGNIIEKMQKAGVRPTISNITIKSENGTTDVTDKSQIPGTKLQINFNASITNGTVKVTPAIPYTTNGTETEVTFTVVGIVDLLTPSIYASPAMLINIVQNARNSDDNIMDIGTSFVYNDNEETDITQILDYKLFDDKITLEKGRFPENDYEVIVNISHKYDMKLNKTIPVTVNDTKLTVVGYYDSQENIDTYLVNNNTVKYKLIGERKEFMIYTKDKDKVLSDFRSLDLNIIDTYENSKKDFLRQKRESMKTSLIVSAIILAISLVEIFLMIRSSFLSRIKEIGILRAIGIKKMDIYKMFAGETIAITTLASIPGILLMVYILKTLSQMAYFSNFFLVNTWSIIATIIFIYAFNLIVGLLPVHNVVKKTPAQILSRYDI